MFLLADSASKSSQLFSFLFSPSWTLLIISVINSWSLIKVWCHICSFIVYFCNLLGIRGNSYVIPWIDNHLWWIFPSKSDSFWWRIVSADIPDNYITIAFLVKKWFMIWVVKISRCWNVMQESFRSWVSNLDFFQSTLSH